MSRKIYPEFIKERRSYVPGTVELGDYDAFPLEVDGSGNVLNASFDGLADDTFVCTKRKHDMDCLAKVLPPEVLRRLSHTLRAEWGDCVVRRPKREDFFSILSKGRRAKNVYNLSYCMGKSVTPETLVEDARTFVADLSSVFPFRPVVTQWADFFLDSAVKYSQVSGHKVPQSAMRLFHSVGRGGNLNTSIIGEDSCVKVDRSMAYLWALSQCQSTSPSSVTGRGWKHDMTYDMSDAYGCYEIDCWVSPELTDSPVSVLRGETYVPVVGNIHVRVLKPTMDLLKFMETLGMAKVSKVHDAVRLEGGCSYPFRELYEALMGFRASAGSASHFIKLVGTVTWGKLLQTYPVLDARGEWHIMGGEHFNPVAAYTATDLIRARNFLMRLNAGGRISAELVDALYGTDEGTWCEEGMKIEGPSKCVHLNPVIHALKSKDVRGIYSRIEEQGSKKVLEVPMETRYTFGAFRTFESSSEARDVFGAERTKVVRVRIGSDKMDFPPDVGKLQLGDLKNVQLRGRVFLLDEAMDREIGFDWSLLNEFPPMNVWEEL